MPFKEYNAFKFQFSSKLEFFDIFKEMLFCLRLHFLSLRISHVLDSLISSMGSLGSTISHSLTLKFFYASVCCIFQVSNISTPMWLTLQIQLNDFFYKLLYTLTLEMPLGFLQGYFLFFSVVLMVSLLICDNCFNINFSKLYYLCYFWVYG